MIKRIFILSGFLAILAFANAQTGEEQDLWELKEQKLIGTGQIDKSNLSYIEQSGSLNQVVAIQEQQQDLSNHVFASQNGSANTGYLKQQGEGHQTVLSQNGNGNMASMWSVGGRTFNTVSQNGNGNEVNQYIENDSYIPKTAISVQRGHNNKIDVALLNETDFSPFLGSAVFQNGSGNEVELILKQSNSLGIVVTQTGNFSEKVSITHTDFAFPK